MISVLVAATGSSSLAVTVAVVATLVVVALLVALMSMVRAARALRDAAEQLARQSEELLDRVGGTLAHADAELARVDDLVGSAEALSETVGTASRAAYVTLANPLIKVMAFRRGSARAAQRWRARGAGPASGRGSAPDPSARPVQVSSRARG